MKISARICALALALSTIMCVDRNPAAAQGVSCNNSVAYDTNTNGVTELVPAATSKKIYVCGFSFMVGPATNVSLVYGTGTACATGQVALTPAYQISANGGIVVEAPNWNGMFAPASNALCLKTSAGNAVQALVKFVVK